MACLLLVDDDPDFRAIAQHALEEMGSHQVDVAQDGVEALERLERTPMPDLIISDVLMPRMGGFELLAKLRQMEIEIPVIFTSSLGGDSSTRIDGLRLGALDFLAKPCTLEELVLRVERLMTAATLIHFEDEAQDDPPPLTVPPEFITEMTSDASAEHLLDLTDHVVEPPDSHVPSDDTDPEEPRGLFFASPDLRGRIERLGLPALFALAESERKDGILAAGTRERSVWVVISQGRPIRAVTVGGTEEIRGPEAIYTALAWPRGYFEYMTSEISGETEMQMGFTHLLMEFAQRSDEAGR